MYALHYSQMSTSLAVGLKTVGRNYGHSSASEGWQPTHTCRSVGMNRYITVNRRRWSSGSLRVAIVGRRMPGATAIRQSARA